MVWRADGPQGRESLKVRFDVVPYLSGRVLDLGCGDTKISPVAIGVDNRLDFALYGMKIEPDVAVDTCERLPLFATESIDTVYSSHLLEHIVNYEAAITEWWRLVKVGGYLVLYLPHKDLYPNIGQPGGNADHKHDFLPGDITQAMTAVADRCGQGWDLEVNEDRAQDFEYSFLQVYRKTDRPYCVTSALGIIPKKRLGLVRLGAYGDALWTSSILPHFKSQGYHITVYTQPQGEVTLRNDPNIDRLIVQPIGLFESALWQTAYWLHEEKKYEKFLNLIGAVERRLLPQPSEPDFYLPDEQRFRMMDRNYLEALHEWADVPFDRQTVLQKFYPTDEERAEAVAERALVRGPLVVINPAGSSIPKWWPYAQDLADLLAAEGIHSLIVGDLRHVKFRSAGKYGRVIGLDWPIRKVFAVAALADVVVGTESAIVNAVAYEAPLKIVLLSHSSATNLTRDWTNTIALAPNGLACYPCHRIHADFTHCNLNRKESAAACQAALTAEAVFAEIMEYARPAGIVEAVEVA